MPEAEPQKEKRRLRGLNRKMRSRPAGKRRIGKRGSVPGRKRSLTRGWRGIRTSCSGSTVSCTRAASPGSISCAGI